MRIRWRLMSWRDGEERVCGCWTGKMTKMLDEWTVQRMMEEGGKSGGGSLCGIAWGAYAILYFCRCIPRWQVYGGEPNALAHAYSIFVARSLAISTIYLFHAIPNLLEDTSNQRKHCSHISRLNTLPLDLVPSHTLLQIQRWASSLQYRKEPTACYLL